jgi:hypothetical protein
MLAPTRLGLGRLWLPGLGTCLHLSMMRRRRGADAEKAARNVLDMCASTDTCVCTCVRSHVAHPGVALQQLNLAQPQRLLGLVHRRLGPDQLVLLDWQFVMLSAWMLAVCRRPFSSVRAGASKAVSEVGCALERGAACALQVKRPAK